MFIEPWPFCLSSSFRSDMSFAFLKELTVT